MARRQAGLTQHELANRASTSQAAISAYESGGRSPSVDTLCRILAAAGFEVRMRLAEPNTHDQARLLAERSIPAGQLAAHKQRKRLRVTRSHATP
jgi:transcriptional regulator with XRE-family HTH domain